MFRMQHAAAINMCQTECSSQGYVTYSSAYKVWQSGKSNLHCTLLALDCCTVCCVVCCMLLTVVLFMSCYMQLTVTFCLLCCMFHAPDCTPSSQSTEKIAPSPPKKDSVAHSPAKYSQTKCLLQ